MKKVLFLVFVLFFLFSFSFSEEIPDKNSAYPDFSWDTVPTFAFLASGRHFTDEQAEFLAKHYSLVSTSIQQGIATEMKVEEARYYFARQLKKANPDVKVLFYWNSTLARPYSRAYETFNANPQWKLHDKYNNTVIQHNVEVYDLSNPEVRHWWTSVCVQACSNPYIDGIFADGISYFAIKKNPHLKFELEESKEKAIRDGLYQLLKETSKAIGPKDMIIFNGLRGEIEDYDGGMKYLDHTCGAMVEYLGHYQNGRLNQKRLRHDIDLIQKTGKQGKIVLAKGWPKDFQLTEKISVFYKLDKRQQEKVLKDSLTLPLAAFLIAAEKYAYFGHSVGWSGQSGWFYRPDEFNKPLGPPRGPAKKEGLVYTREFEHARVWLDIENEQARIDWDQ